MKKIRSLFPKLSAGEKPDFVIWCFPVIGFLILCLIPILITQNDLGKITVAGIAGPVISLVAALLCFIAFWVLLQSNTSETFNEPLYQPAENNTDNIENRFHELLRIHRANIGEINIGNKTNGHKAFVSLFNEFKCCYHVLASLYASQKELKQVQSTLSEQDKVNIAYIIFFMGIDNAFSEMTRGLLSQYEPILIEKYTATLKKLQKKHNDEGHITILTGNTVLGIKLKYKPFTGHMQRLENYYRHLFQTVKFVVEHEGTESKDKYEFLKVLRAQLTGHEQLMLYYNSLSILGKPWIENNYFTEYRMIKNLPLPLADFGERPKDKLGELNSKGELLFEWDEISFRNKFFRPIRYTKAEQN